MLITLAILCAFVAWVSAQGCSGHGACNCVPTIAERDGACATGVSATGTIDTTPGGQIGCKTSSNTFACDNNGLIVPQGHFCCNAPAPPTPPACAPAIGAVTFLPGALRCNGDTNGEFLVTSIGGGTSPVKVQVNGGPLQSNIAVGGPGTGTPATGLHQGPNTVIVTNNEGCTSAPQTVSASGIIAVTLPDTSGPLNVSNPFCFGGLGRIRLVPATGGQPPHNYSLDNFATSQLDIVFSGLPAGTYTFIAKDSTGCISNTITKTLTQPGSAVAFNTLGATAPLCGPNSNTTVSGALGIITATGTGGTGGKTFSLDGGAFQASGTFNDVSVGTHTVTVRDALGCAFTQIVTVPSQADLVAPSFVFGVAALPCAGSFTTLTVTGPDTYQIDGTPQASGVPRAVTGTTHTIKVTTAAGCTKTFPAVIPLGSGGLCNDNIGTTTGDTCHGSQCSGGCIPPANQKTCPVGMIGIQLETNLLLCATQTPKNFGLKQQLSNWAFFDGSQAPSSDPEIPDRISLPELNTVFSGLFTKKTVGGVTTYTSPTGATIVFNTPGCFVTFDKLDRKRWEPAAPEFNVLTLGGKPSL